MNETLLVGIYEVPTDFLRNATVSALGMRGGTH
jgi:hypothetical protein